LRKRKLFERPPDAGLRRTELPRRRTRLLAAVILPLTIAYLVGMVVLVYLSAKGGAP